MKNECMVTEIFKYILLIHKGFLFHIKTRISTVSFEEKDDLTANLWNYTQVTPSVDRKMRKLPSAVLSD